MAITGIGSRSTLVVQALVDMRRQLDDLQRQLGTGKKSDNYAGIGLGRSLGVGLRAHMSSLNAFDDAISNVGVRMDLAQSVLGRLTEIGHTVKAAAFQATANVDSSGQTAAQLTADAELSEIIGLLNTKAGDRYLFSGRAADQPAVASFEYVMNGDGARAGFKQIIAERRLADIGANGLGRLNLSVPTATSIALAEDAAASPFGFKLSGITSGLTNAVLAGPAGAPASISVDLTGGNPSDGETIQFRFDLPDGSSQTLTLTATSAATPGPNQFGIGATPAATTANLQAALSVALGKLAATSLTAASAVAAADDFFNVDVGNPPKRVAGPPFDSATGFAPGTAVDTVFWYTGEIAADPARSAATARVDSSISISYGLRANEQGIRFLVQNVAALAAVTFSSSDPNADALGAALNERVGMALDVPPGIQTVDQISAELAGAQMTLQAAADRHLQTKATLADMLEQIEGVSTEEVAAQILAQQTRLQASLQTTALLFEMSLVRFI
jgi:flagellin-like hook-associated protein FlgL